MKCQEVKNKEKEIAEKWKSARLKQNIADPYEFLQQNQKMIFDDLGELWAMFYLNVLTK